MKPELKPVVENSLSHSRNAARLLSEIRKLDVNIFWVPGKVMPAGFSFSFGLWGKGFGSSGVTWARLRYRAIHGTNARFE
jgi:hypothetical protein